MSSSINGWNNVKKCILIGKECNPWHIDCQIDDDYILTVYDKNQSISVWKSKDGVTFHFVKVVLVCNNVLGSYYNKSLYRACLCKINEGYRMYFSARNAMGSSVGLMEGKTIFDLKVINGGKDLNLKDFLGDFVYKYTYAYKLILRTFSKIKKMFDNFFGGGDSF